AREFRARGVPVVAGGFHPTLLPAEAAEHVDSVAIGEVEAIWPRLLADFAAGRLQPVYGAHDHVAVPESRLDGNAAGCGPGSGPAPSPIAGAESPEADRNGGPATPFRSDRRVFAGKRYLPLSLVETSRGCRHHCRFCSVRRFYGNGIVHRPLPDLVREIEALGRRFVFFVDDNIVADPARARELFAAIRPLGLRWVSQASLATAADPAFLDLMVESGCFALIIGLESIFPANLEQMGKGWSTRLGYLETLLAEYRRRGILVYATFVFGYDQDTPERIRETAEFAIAQRLFLANFNMLQPFPGTQLYDELEREGRLLYPRWWLAPDLRWDRPTFRPRAMSPDDLATAVADARRRFSGLSSLFQRAGDLQANFADPFRALVYLAGNLVSRGDIAHKTGLRLGFGGKDSP
ncbi:MAG: B12-binding domain-containing radical SAM protein, partial [Candidatus Riflebacteria bacterium]|nr:B12-binding domain-containing radical SAM protein [Candidatus Riflebacteria bacterium]